MKIVESSFRQVFAPTYQEMLNVIEAAYRICYLSEPKNTTQEAFIKSKLKLKHETPLEHCSITLKIICNRAMSHEIVRHRLVSLNQESQRYVDYSHGKHDGEVKFIAPMFKSDSETFVFDMPKLTPCPYGHMPILDIERGGSFSKKDIWERAMQFSEYFYQVLKMMDTPSEEAREVLPNSTKTEMIFTANLREWRHILNLRALGKTGRPYPPVQKLMMSILDYFVNEYPVFFEDLEVG
jgi:thymidylate synthase (FAD)